MRRALCISACLISGAAWGQEDDRDYLTAFLEDSLSDAGRQVTVTGFAGALSSQATIESLTIADDEGIWITLNDVALDWSRSSLLSGELLVDQLSAAEIILVRIPEGGDSALPSPEAAGFSLPELPVSINVERIAAERIELGPEVLGQPVTGTLEASLTLAGGEGEAEFDLVRTGDGPKGKITLDASYANATRDLQLSLVAEEDAGGIVVGLLGIPGAPSAALTVEGQGPIDDFTSDLQLATAGKDRLAGTVKVRNEAEAGYRLLVDVAGNLAPILLPDYVSFFGESIALKFDARRSPLGEVTVDDFDLFARTIRISGRAVIASDGLPQVIDLTGLLADPDGKPLLLPLIDQPTLVDKATFSLTTDEKDSTRFEVGLTVTGLDRPDLKAAQIVLSGEGGVSNKPEGRLLGMRLGLKADGLAPSDPGLSAALGPWLQAGLRLRYLGGSDVLRLSDMFLVGDDLDAKANLKIEGLATGLLTTGILQLETEDLARFSGLAGRPLAGKGIVRLKGSAGLLSGIIDGEAQLEATGLQLGITELDRLLSGPAALRVSVLRNETGTTLRSLDLTVASLSVTASGSLATAGSSLDGEITIANLSDLGPPYAGSVDLTAAFSGTPEDGQLAVLGTGRGLRVGSAEADRLLAGTSAIEATLRLRDGAVEVDEARIANPQLTATAKGLIEGATRRIDLEARLANLGLIVPEVDGPLTVTGTASQDGRGYSLDVSARGPGQIVATVKGSVANGFRTADLTISGTGQAGLANLFVSPRSVSGLVGYDLQLDGPLALGSLTGRVTLSNGRIADPRLGLSLQDVEGIGQLRGGELRLAATSALSTGGKLRVDGPIGLAAPNTADLAITLEALRLYDPELYETRIGGELTLKGPLAGGALLSGTLDLSETEVRVPSSGFNSAAALLDIRHVNEPEPVRTTRRKAGLLGEIGSRSGTGRSTKPIALDLTIRAPSKVFIRGRGIDAELGGELRLAGTTANVVPSGAFRLIRGRMDILGERLVLSRADLVLEGSLVPEIDVAADTENDGIVSTVTVEGPADDPTVSFTSSPELPQEEVLAQLLFGRSLDTISALQAAQLANAVAVLAGRGGLGLVGKLRQNLGLDDFDVSTADDGTTALKAGKYISDNAYTEIEIGQDGKSRINLNLDLREGVTVKGRVGEDGDTGIGVYLEKDY
jgi:translocation and assembly module TamB